jgi:hypothetical protein
MFLEINMSEQGEHEGKAETITSPEVSEAARALGMRGASKGGKARAAKLSPEARVEIARRAIQARWAKAKGEKAADSIPVATHAGVLPLGGLNIPCAVLEDETRVLTQEGFLSAIGRAKKAKGGQGAQNLPVDQLPPFLAAKNLKPFISNELIESTRPIVFVPLNPINPSHRAYGFKATLLPMVCNVYLDAKEAGVLTHSQMRIAEQCRILSRAFSLVGIIALIDEATGYQDVRPQAALAQILEMYIAKDLARWVKTFPDSFYERISALKGWPYQPGSSRRSKAFAQITLDLVYSRLAPGVLEELQRLTPKDEKGRRKYKLFQRLTEEYGHPKLKEHMAAVLALLQAFDAWDQFYLRLERIFPQWNQTMLLPLRYDDDEVAVAEKNRV